MKLITAVSWRLNNVYHRRRVVRAKERKTRKNLIGRFELAATASLLQIVYGNALKVLRAQRRSQLKKAAIGHSGQHDV